MEIPTTAKLTGGWGSDATRKDFDVAHESLYSPPLLVRKSQTLNFEEHGSRGSMKPYRQVLPEMCVEQFKKLLQCISVVVPKYCVAWSGCEYSGISQGRCKLPCVVADVNKVELIYKKLFFQSPRSVIQCRFQRFLAGFNIFV